MRCDCDKKKKSISSIGKKNNCMSNEERGRYRNERERGEGKIDVESPEAEK